MTFDRRSRFRRPPAVHRPVLPAPETPAEVLERAPDVSRETSPDLTAPPLRKDQVARLEALTAVWERQVRLEGPTDATLLYAAPPPPPPRPRAGLEVVQDPAPPPVPDPARVADRSRALREQDTADRRLPVPAPGPAPVRDGEPAPAPARVSDWTSRHDPRSLEFPVRQRLARAVPLQDVSLEAGPVLDQGTAPPLTVREASACVGMASAVAANVLGATIPMDEDDARLLYDLAQDRDHVHGRDYPGTSVLGGMRAGQELGWWGGYLWALGGTKDVAQVLIQLRVAVVVGVPWSAGDEQPDRHGVITPGGANLGGHALAVVGLRLGMLGGRPGPWFELQQSRGRAEGLAGRVFLHHSHLARKLAGIGEAAVPLPAELLR